MPKDWHRFHGSGVMLDVPDVMAPAGEAGMDSPSVTLVGPGLRLIVDRSPFADPLTRYESRPEYTRTREEIGGRLADVVSFRADDGTRVVAARLPETLTAVAHLAPSLDLQVALRMLRSIRTTDKED